MADTKADLEDAARDAAFDVSGRMLARAEIRAVWSVVLADLMEPSEGMHQATHRHATMTQLQKNGWVGTVDGIWRAMITQWAKERGIETDA